MKKLLALATTIVVLLGLVPFLDYSNAEITVGGLINTDTVWSRGNTYVLSGSIQIPQGVKLTIESGVTVHLASYSIQVNGDLKAQGTSASPLILTGSDASFYGSADAEIKFMDTSTSWNDLSASGCIMQNAIIRSISISINNCSPRISHNNLNQSTISVSGGESIIENNEIYGAVAGHGITIGSGSATISGNYLHDTSGIYAKGSAYVYNNRVDSCWDGIKTAGQTTVKGNTVSHIKGGGAGIMIEADNPAITGNYVCTNYYGITVAGSGIIEGNTIVDNTVGIQIFQADTTLSIRSNSIYNNTQYNLRVGTSTNINAANNYWGTTSNEAIGQTIHDYSDDYSLGKVTYSPYLTQPSANSPSTAGATNSWASVFISFDYGLEVLILQIAEIVIITLTVGWAIVIGVVLCRRSKKRRQYTA